MFINNIHVKIKKKKNYREEMFTVNSMMNKGNTTQGWYYGNDTVKKTIQKNTNNDFPNSPQTNEDSFFSTVKSTNNQEYSTFIERNESVVVHKEVNNPSLLNKNNRFNHFDEEEEDEDDDMNFTCKKKPEKEKIDDLVEKSKLMSISNTYRKSGIQFNIENAVEINDEDDDIFIGGNKISQKANVCYNKLYNAPDDDDDFPTVRKRPTNAQPDIEVLNSIETIYEMVI